MVTISLLIIYLVVLAGITVYAHVRQTEQGFLGMEQNVTAHETTWTTFASIISGYNLAFGVTFSYLYGVWYLLIFVGAAASFAAYYYIYKHFLYKYQATHPFTSLADYFGHKYGTSTRHILNVVLVLALLIFLTLQIYVNTSLLTVLLGVGALTATLLTAGVVATYLWCGGFTASVRTDIFQGLLMIPIVLVILFFPRHITTSNIGEVASLEVLPMGIALMVLQFFVLLGQTECFQRIYTVKDALSLRRGLTRAFGLICLLALAMAYIGINFKLAGGEVDVANLFVTGVLPALPAWLASLLAISLTAAFMGNIDSTAFALGSSLARAASSSRFSMKTVTRVSMVIAILIASYASLYLSGFIAPVFSLVAVLAVVGGALVLSTSVRVTKRDINVFLVAGVAFFLAGTAFGVVTGDPLTALYPIGVGILALVLVRISVFFYTHLRT